MAHIVEDNVRESATTTGTGSFSLGGALTTGRTFASVCADADTIHYSIHHDSLNEWEVGLGTYETTGNLLLRTTPLESSNGGAAVNFSAGDKRVELVLPGLLVRQIYALQALTGVVRVDAGVLSADTDVTDIVAAASETVAGKIEIATSAEVNTGSDNTRAVSPAGLTAWTGDSAVVTVGTLASGDATAVVSAATESLAGKLEIATAAETITGTDDARAVTPLKLAALLGEGGDDADGATITLGSGNSFNLITSTTAITAFAFTDDDVGRKATIRFNTARTLTHNGTSLIIPGAANITTAAGDVCEIESRGSGNFRVNWYTKATGFSILHPVASDTVAGVLEIAIQSEQETGTDVVRAVSPGRQHFHPSAAKFWAKWQGNSTTINASFNVTSITDGTTETTITIATDFSSANWCGLALALGANSTAGTDAKFVTSFTQTATALSLAAWDGTGTQLEEDPTSWFCAGFGDQ